MQDTRDTMILVFGNNSGELEAEAMKYGRAVFNDGVPLVVDRSYSIYKTRPSDAVTAPDGMTLGAYIKIQVAPGVINPAFPEKTSYLKLWRLRWVR